MHFSKRILVAAEYLFPHRKALKHEIAPQLGRVNDYILPLNQGINLIRMLAGPDALLICLAS